MNIFEANSADQALQYLQSLASAAGYNIFRGQRRPWPLLPSLARLAEDEQVEARNRLERFVEWSRATPATRAYVDLEDAAVAIAQHYGIATNLLDWSFDPYVALFFALDGKKVPDERPIVFAARSEEISGINGCRLVKIHVPNLWRLEAQNGLFVEIATSLARSKLEARCQAVTFPRPAINIFDRSYFYPPRKSDLETRISQFFPLDAVEKVKKTLLTEVSLFAMHRWCTYSGAIFGRAIPPPNEKWESDLPRWLITTVEPLSPGASSLDLSITIPQNESTADQHVTLSNRFLSQAWLRNRNAKVSFRGGWGVVNAKVLQRADQALDAFWDGVRRLPFSDGAIAEGLATLAISISKYLESGTEMEDIFADLFGETIVVEFADYNGLNQAAVASREGLAKVINLDTVEILTPYVRRRVLIDPIDVFSFVVDPYLICDLGKLASLMAREIIPAQMAYHFRQGLEDDDWDSIFEAPSFDPAHLGYLSTSRFRFDFAFSMDPQPDDTIYLFQDMTEDEVAAEILSAELARRSGPNEAFFLRIHGWVHDQRELWQIPEAVELLRQFAAHGGMSPLEVFERRCARREYYGGPSSGN